MKQLAYNTMGLKVNFEVPETVAEFDKNAGVEGACLKEAINNIIYRGSLAEFRDAFLHGIEAADGKPAILGVEATTKIDRLTKVKKKDEKGNEILDWAETELDYFKKVCATQKVDPASFQVLADSIAKTIKFDAKASEAKPKGPKKLAEKYRITAEALLKGPKANITRFLKDAATLLAKPFAPTGDNTKDTEPLGWYIKEFSDAKDKQLLAGIVGT